MSATDLEFVATAVSNHPSCDSRSPATDSRELTTDRHDSLTQLLSEPEALDAALESDKLFKLLLESPGSVPVTPQLYFYVLTRHMLQRFDRDVADYVAHVLVDFVTTGHLSAIIGRDDPAGRPRLPDPDQPHRALPYITDLLIALQSASSEKEFFIRVKVGNYSLFLSGIFPQHIAHRVTHRAAPPLAFYEEVGSQNYRLASDHRLAREQSLVETYRTIAEHFTEVRAGLNQMADRLLSLEPMA